MQLSLPNKLFSQKVLSLKSSIGICIAKRFDGLAHIRLLGCNACKYGQIKTCFGQIFGY